MSSLLNIKVNCPKDSGIHGRTLDNMPFVPAVGDDIKIGGDWKKVVTRKIELNNLGWDATSRVEITVE